MLQIEEPHIYRFAFHHLGFRPFFLLAGVHAVLVVALWAWLYHGQDASPLIAALPPSSRVCSFMTRHHRLQSLR